MFENYLKTTIRILWRKRLFSVLNVLGLAIGMSACWVIYRIVEHEFSYDAKLPNKEHIYQVVSSFSDDAKMGGVSPPLYQGIRAEIPGIEQVVPVVFQSINSAEIKRDGKEVFMKEDPDRVVATDGSYFNMLPYTWLAGDKRTALHAPGSVVLTASRAREYFPLAKPEEIVQQSIMYYGRDTILRTVTGIVADYPAPSEFIAQEFFSLPKHSYETYMWTNTNGSDKVYLQLKEGVRVKDALARINELEARYWKAFGEERGEALKRSKSYELLPVNEIHFATHVDDYFGVTKTSKHVMYGLMGIGGFLLLLACINYINMSVAQMPQRAKEIGVRKTLGCGRGALIGQLLIETFLTTLLSAVLAFAFGRLAFWGLADIIPPGVTPQGTVYAWLFFTLGLVVLTTLSAGLYPSWLITKVKTLNVLKNDASMQLPRQFSLQKMLIVFQFFIALVFIISTIIVGAQLRYTLKADMGFNKEAVVLVDIPWKYLNDPRYRDKQFTLTNELRNTPGIEAVALGNAPLAYGASSAPFEYMQEDKGLIEKQLDKKWIDTAYLGLYQITLLAGRNIQPLDTLNEYIINESAAKVLGFTRPQEAVGKLIGQRGNPKYTIVGVVKDFHTANFYTPINPLILMAGKPNLYTLNIKLSSRNTDQWQTALKAMEKKWSSIYPAHAFQYRFYDDSLKKLYQQERQIAKLIHLATAITILISCLGLFGLATLIASQRTKEIGIRKVLGATVTGIVALLSKDFLKLVLIAMIIASPIAWWAMNKWLEAFVYRIDIQWWMFAAAGITAAIIALITVSWQAIRAALANPVKSLRNE